MALYCCSIIQIYFGDVSFKKNWLNGSFGCIYKKIKIKWNSFHYASSFETYYKILHHKKLMYGVGHPLSSSIIIKPNACVENMNQSLLKVATVDSLLLHTWTHCNCHAGDFRTTCTLPNETSHPWMNHIVTPMVYNVIWWFHLIYICV